MSVLSRVDIAELADCEKCGLFRGCKSPLMKGRGSPTARLVIVGEAPGRVEDRKGRPFVGPSGQFLDGCLQDAGIDPADCFWTNVSRCWPGLDEKGGDAKATDKQLKACAPAAVEEIRRLQPKVVLLLGGKAIKGVLGLDKISEQRGRLTIKDGIAYVAAYHPAYVLREVKHLRAGETSRALDAWQQDINLVVGALSGKSKIPAPPLPIVPQTTAEFRSVLKMARESRLVAYDYETTGLSPYAKNAKLLTVSLAWRDVKGKLRSAFVPLDHPETPWDHLSLIEVKQELRDFLASPKLHLIGSNLKFEYCWSALHLGVEPAGFPWSTDLMHALIDEKKDPGHGLKILASLVGYGGYEKPLDDWLESHVLVYPEAGEEGSPPWELPPRPQVREIQPGERVKPMTKGDLEFVPLDEIRPYNAADAYVNYLVFEHLAPILEANDQVYLYKHVTRRQTRMLARMELQGLVLDVKEQRRQQLAAARRLEELTVQMAALPKVERYARARAAHERTTWEAACGGFREDGKTWVPAGTDKPTRSWPFKWTDRATGEPLPLSFGSDPQLKDYFYGYLQYPVKRRTKTGPALDKLELQRLSPKRDGLAALLVEFRRVKKLKEAFLDPAPGWIADDGKVHTNFKIAGTEAGRLSSTDPNLQQTPREGSGSEIKRMYKSSFPGGFLVEADQGQIEPRLIACDSQDPAMLAIVRNPKIDLHTGFTAMAWKIAVEEVTKDMRQKGKSLISLGTLYGQAAKGLAEKMGWTLAHAQEFLDELWGMLEGVARWQAKVKKQAREKGYAETRMGRRRHLEAIRSDDEYERGEAERQAVNMRIQGLATDIVQVQGDLIDREFLRQGMRSRLVLTVHDSLVSDTPEDETAEVAVIQRRFMEDASLLPDRFALTIPLQADVAVGADYGRKQEFKSKDYPADDDLRRAVEKYVRENRH